MRAVWLREFGGPEVLVPGTAPDPAPGPGQVLVDVAHANITFVETMFRATGFGPFGAELPLIPGNGVGGTITELGPGVDPALAGRVVVTATGGTGGYAERVVVDQGAPVRVPAGRGGGADGRRPDRPDAGPCGRAAAG
ncbi:alcohol dehydrogenase catalytic domain-containing protein [Micromonospora echinospora]|uniref:alcohol dehydrogenase catalytic domain-containing protein n=1 Tax=Micromonospora echinospora TaxID=1877 RepID=UPI003CE8E7BB